MNVKLNITFKLLIHVYHQYVPNTNRANRLFAVHQPSRESHCFYLTDNHVFEKIKPTVLVARIITDNSDCQIRWQNGSRMDLKIL